MEAAGLAEPSIQRHGSGSASGDAADSPLMSEGSDPMLLPEPEPEPPPRPATAPDSETVWDALRRVLGEILCHDNARLTTECIALVSGLNYSGASMTEIARTPRHHARRRLQTLRRADRTARPAALPRHALVDSPPAVSLRQNPIRTHP